MTHSNENRKVDLCMQASFRAPYLLIMYLLVCTVVSSFLFRGPQMGCDWQLQKQSLRSMSEAFHVAKEVGELLG